MTEEENNKIQLQAQQQTLPSCPVHNPPQTQQIPQCTCGLDAQRQAQQTAQNNNL